MTITEFRKLSQSEKAAQFDPCAVAEYRVYDKVLFATLQALREEYRDGRTPGEELISGLLLAYSFRPLTPEEVASEVDSFGENYDDLITYAKRAIAEYPQDVGILEVADA